MCTYVYNSIIHTHISFGRCGKWSTSENDPHGKIRKWSPYKESDPHTNKESDHHILFGGFSWHSSDEYQTTTDS